MAPDGPRPWRVGDGPPPYVPASERRKRRREVERRVLDGEPHLAVAEAVAAAYGVGVRTVKRDVALVLKRWVREDRRGLQARRSRVVRALERNAADCRRAGDLAGERDALRSVAKVLGMGAPAVVATVNVDARRIEETPLDVRLRQIAEADRILAALRGDEEAGGRLGVTAQTERGALPAATPSRGKTEIIAIARGAPRGSVIAGTPWGTVVPALPETTEALGPGTLPYARPAPALPPGTRGDTRDPRKEPEEPGDSE